MRLNKHQFTIVGVTPQGFNGTLLFFQPDIFAPIIDHPLFSTDSLTDRGNRWVFMTLGDLGLASAILQQRDLNEGQASAVFHINLLAGFACGLIFLASSPLLGYFYADTRVTKVAAALSFRQPGARR